MEPHVLNSEYKVVADEKEVGQYNSVDEIKEIVIESLGKGKKKIYIEEVGKDD